MVENILFSWRAGSEIKSQNWSLQHKAAELDIFALGPHGLANQRSQIKSPKPNVAGSILTAVKPYYRFYWHLSY